MVILLQGLVCSVQVVPVCPVRVSQLGAERIDYLLSWDAAPASDVAFLGVDNRVWPRRGNMSLYDYPGTFVYWPQLKTWIELLQLCDSMWRLYSAEEDKEIYFFWHSDFWPFLSQNLKVWTQYPFITFMYWFFFVINTSDFLPL